MAVPLSRATPLPYSTLLTSNGHYQYSENKVPICEAHSMQPLTIACHAMDQTVYTTRRDIAYGHIGLEDSCSGTSASHCVDLEQCHWP